MSLRRVLCAAGVLVIASSILSAEVSPARRCALGAGDSIGESRAVLKIATASLGREADASSFHEPLVPVTAEDVLKSAQRRVRAVPRRLRGIPAEGFSRSSTFAGLLLALQGGDVIVHVHDSPYPLASRGAELVMGPKVGRFRFLRVQVGNGRLGDDLIALVGHELFHALEIAHSPDVTSHASVGSLFRRIGYKTFADEHFDSDGARAVERRIRQELSTTCR